MSLLTPKYDKQNDRTKEAKHKHIGAFRKYAELAQASYCPNLKAGMGKMDNDINFVNALTNENYKQCLTRDNAIRLTNIYEILAHYMPKQKSGFFGSIQSFFDDDGFSATLFQDKSTKEFIFATGYTK